MIRAGVGDAEYRRDLVEAREIDDALQRMKDGRFGSCVDCGEPIPPPRLIATPWAARCVECQRGHEQAASREAG